MRVVYGIEVDKEPVDYLQIAEDMMTILSETLQPGKYFIELLPFLRHLPSWVPGATVKRKGVAWRRVVWKLVEQPWKFVKVAVVCILLYSFLSFAFYVDDFMVETRNGPPIHGGLVDGRHTTITWRMR